MKSPFPGMDPYIEGNRWGDFHATFIPCWREAIEDQLPEGFVADINEYVTVSVPHQSARRQAPDVFVVKRGDPDRPSENRGPAKTGSSVSLLEPVELENEYLNDLRWPFIEIRKADERVIAVLELLSPANKSGENRGEYLNKRNSILRSGAHLVELDLLIAGRRIPFHKELPAGDYYAFVSRSDRKPICEVYAWQIPHPLPAIPIPLVSPHDDLQIDLATVFATAYERGRYRRKLRYDDPPAAPIRDELLQWVNQIAASVAPA
jgi:hypothetical protein